MYCCSKVLVNAVPRGYVFMYLLMAVMSWMVQVLALQRHLKRILQSYMGKALMRRSHRVEVVCVSPWTVMSEIFSHFIQRVAGGVRNIMIYCWVGGNKKLNTISLPVFIRSLYARKIEKSKLVIKELVKEKDEEKERLNGVIAGLLAKKEKR
ncbi:hypothetical protein Hanom_Chr08g00750551 [Helianthus anomalus]